MKIYGQHDDRTVQQLERCVAAEDGAQGVLCADGHVGYSCPIGGVIAYRHHVSPSGVGFDQACGNYRACDYAAPFATHERGVNDALPLCPKCGGKLRHRGKQMTRVSNGLVDFEAEKAKLTGRGIILRGAGADEAPPVYRPLESVLAAHAGTIEIAHVLQPRIVVMAGGDEYDPYKD